MSKKQTKTIGKKNKRATADPDAVHLNVVEGIAKKDLFSFILGFILVVMAIFLLVSFVSYLYTGAVDFDKIEGICQNDFSDGHFRNVCGPGGAWLADFFLNRSFGLASFLLIPLMVMLGLRMMGIFRIRLVRKTVLGLLLMLWCSVFLAFVGSMIPGLEDSFLNLGGNHGNMVVRRVTAAVGTPGLLCLLLVTAVLYLIDVSARTIEYIRSLFRLSFIKKIKMRRRKEEEEEEREAGLDVTRDETEAEESDSAAGQTDQTVPAAVDEAGAEEKEDEDVRIAREFEKVMQDNVLEFHGNDLLPRPEAEAVAEGGAGREGEREPTFDVTASKTEEGTGEIERGDINTPYDPKLDLESYKYPPLSLIVSGVDSSPSIDMAEQNANKDRITHVLRQFGVEISSIKATIGPTITLYEIVPAEGTRISKIRNLEDDIALSLAAEGIRIIAPIPGKGTIGIEVPNKKKCIVSMESILSSKVYQDSTMELPCAVGKTITNEVFMFDLAKAPHLLVAGATGQGKSVGLNAIIASLLYKKHPAELKIVMVDPKKVEFSIYAPIENHFLARLEEEEDCIITDVQKVVKTLTSLCQLMDTRYDLLKKAGCRNVKEYNAKFKERKLNPEHGHEFMPYIVVVVDEFGDLIMTAGKEVELPICRIAQLARAVGIHMIIATQRPQASIISGAIKTNFPARMAFKVSSMIDSRVVLDRPGAQQLIGRGDMLFLSGSEPVRVQCAFLDTPEVSNICQYIAKQQGYLHPMYLPEVIGEEGDTGGAASVDVKRLDPLFAEVAKFVVNTQQGSTSMIQRNYSIGYNRAGKIMDQLEKMGVVGPQVGSKPREVLIKDPITLESLINSIG
ncbi:MAG: DNA translocase FtsK [Bacteroidaceae bacterium]|nr:DNA translocase FtsK [Bacteroidaceae bacterium]